MEGTDAGHKPLILKTEKLFIGEVGGLALEEIEEEIEEEMFDTPVLFGVEGWDMGEMVVVDGMEVSGIIEVDCEMVDCNEKGGSAGLKDFALGCKKESGEVTSRFLFLSSPTIPS